MADIVANIVRKPVWLHSGGEDRMEVELWSEHPDEKMMVLFLLTSLVEAD